MPIVERTEVFTVGASRLARIQLGEMAVRWWWLLILLPLAALIGGFYDWRWWIAGLLLSLVVYPGLLALAYFYCALSPEAAISVLPHFVEFESEGGEISSIKIIGDDSFNAKAYKGVAIKRVLSDDKMLTLELSEKGKNGSLQRIVIPKEAMAGTEIMTWLEPFFDKY